MSELINQKCMQEKMQIETPQKVINLITRDGRSIQVDNNVIALSNMLKTVINDIDVDTDENEIPLSNVTYNILLKIIEFCEHYNVEPYTEIKKPLPSKEMSENVEKWYADYINVSHEDLIELIMASNYMDIPPLFHLACVKMATNLKEKSIPQLRTMIGVVNDFTPDEEAKIHELNKSILGEYEI